MVISPSTYSCVFFQIPQKIHITIVASIIVASIVTLLASPQSDNFLEILALFVRGLFAFVCVYYWSYTNL